MTNILSGESLLNNMPKKAKSLTYYEAIGRRKSAVARVRLHLAVKGIEAKVSDVKMAKGDIIVNKLPVTEYFTDQVGKLLYEGPLKLTDSLGRFIITVMVQGGGKRGQLDAMVLGISRALLKVDGDNRKKLKPHGLLTRDARVRERRKVGMGGRARRKKQSPKR